MEDDDDTASLLYCDEELVSTPAAAASVVEAEEELLAAAAAAAEEEAEEVVALLEHMMGRQGCYAPSRGYLLDHLQRQGAGVAAARSRGVHYIIYAFGRLGLAAATAFNAVNYLDRFLSINCHLMWEEAWMVELVSVACLSIACKLDEVNIPSLHELQLEEVLGHSFRPATVRDMELTLLKALQWRLACVTPYSFLHLLAMTTTSTAAATAAARSATRLLICSLAEPSLLLRFDPSVVAASALRLCVNQQEEEQRDHRQLLRNDIISRLLVRPTTEEDDKSAHEECLTMMQAVHASSCSLDYFDDTSEQQHQYCSPVSEVLIPFQTHYRPAVSRRRCLFGGSSSTPPPQENTTATTQDDDDGAPN